MKKKNFLIISTILVAIICLITLVGCKGKPAEFTGFEIIGPTEFTAGDFDISNYKLKTKFSDGSTGEVSLTNEMISSSDKTLLGQVGKHEITITYKGKSEVLSVNITSANHNVTFKQQGYEDIVVVVGDAESLDISTIQSPKAVKGYNVKWNIEGIDFTSIKQDLSINAVKTPIEYKITFNLDGGVNNASNPATYNIEDKVVLSNPTKNGYKFVKWQIGNDDTNVIETGSVGEKTATAVWEIETYTITYNLDGGTNSDQNKSTFTVNDLSKPIPLYSATKEDLIFAGWYTETNFVNNINKIKECKNYVLYARYVQCTQGLQFTESTDHTYYSVTGYTGSDVEVFVPSKYNGLPVTQIGNGAFENKNNITYIKLPDSITIVGEGAFKNCTSLTRIAIPEGVTKIKSDTFYNCSNLTSVDLPNSVVDISWYAFTDCSRLTDITIPSGVTYISMSAFYGCSSLASINIPNGVVGLGNGAFYGCSSLTSIDLPSSVTSIGEKAFYGCSSLTSIVIPSKVASFGFCVFGNCENLTSITVEQGNQKYHSKDNSIIETATNTLAVGYKDGNIPNYVTSIGEGAFFRCDELTSIVLHEGITNIGNYAFYECSNLNDITFNGTISTWNSITKGEDWHLNIPAKVVHCTDGDVTI